MQRITQFSRRLQHYSGIVIERHATGLLCNNRVLFRPV